MKWIGKSQWGYAAKAGDYQKMTMEYANFVRCAK